jgi:hypothetical protein
VAAASPSTRQSDSHLGLAFSIADREPAERCALGVAFKLSGTGTEAPVELRFSPSCVSQLGDLLLIGPPGAR